LFAVPPLAGNYFTMANPRDIARENWGYVFESQNMANPPRVKAA
jgi:hypothetical protein